VDLRNIFFYKDSIVFAFKEECGFTQQKSHVITHNIKEKKKKQDSNLTQTYSMPEKNSLNPTCTSMIIWCSFDGGLRKPYNIIYMELQN